MSREVLLGLDTSHLKRAVSLIKQVRATAKEALQKTADVSKEKARQRRLQKRWKARQGQDAVGLQQQRFLGGLEGATSIHERVSSVFDAVQNRSVGSLATAAGQFLPGVGQLLMVAGPIVDALQSYVDEQIAKQTAKLEAKTLARLEEMRVRDDYTRRLEEDPVFQEEQSRRAYRQFQAEEKAFGKRIHSLDLLGEL